MTMSHGIQWYVVQTKPQKEAQVLALLSNADRECFLPQIRTFARIRPLFPSYLFVREDLSDPDRYHMLKYTRGVSRVLGNSEGPIPIRTEVIRIIRSRIDRKSGYVEPRVYLRPGQEYRIRRGPFRDLIGILERVCSDEERVQVLLHLMNRPTRVEMTAQNLARA